MEDRIKPDYWRRVKPGDMILLSDEQALEDSRQKGRGLKPLEFTVKEIQRVRDFGEIGEFLFFRLDPGDNSQELWLLVKIVDSDLALRVYYESEGFETGDRADMIDRECHWLFREPADPENIVFNELKYTVSIPRTEMVDGKEQEFTYVVKVQGEIQGTCEFFPRKTGIGEMIATLVEYRTDGPAQNPEILILEVGSEDNEQGGLIRLLIGSDIGITEAEVFPITK